MTCPGCEHEQADGRTECERCGIVFAKYRAPEQRAAPRPVSDTGPLDEAEPTLLGQLRDAAFTIEAGANPLFVWSRALVYALLAWWTLGFLRHPMSGGYVARSFLHLVNLPLHEGGHIVFMPLGDFMMSLGGSLMQVLVPLACAFTFLRKNRDPFGAAVGLWWAGQSLVDVAPYVADARALQLILLGGYTGQEVEGHDWEAILGRLGLLEWDVALGRGAWTLGALWMLGALAWGGWVLLGQYRLRERFAPPP